MNRNCINCGKDLDQVTASGAYLQRVSPIGEEFEGVCEPQCNAGESTQPKAKPIPRMVSVKSGFADHRFGDSVGGCSSNYRY